MKDDVRKSSTWVTEGSNILGVEDVMGVLLAPFEGGRDILLTLARPIKKVNVKFDNARLSKKRPYLWSPSLYT